MQLLIAEKSELVQERIARIVSSCDKVPNIEYAMSIDDTIDAISNNKIDVIILSLKIIKERGFKIISQLKQYVPMIIIMISNSIPIYKLMLIDAGANLVLDDSEEFEEIPQVLTRLQSVPK
ncbi:MAG: response regulator transcription factor [Ignavibacteriales bacterium]|nr:response regulator transcription factor [Ignavibacteriales bacterium]